VTSVQYIIDRITIVSDTDRTYLGVAEPIVLKLISLNVVTNHTQFLIWNVLRYRYFGIEDNGSLWVLGQF
jgi:hypothetical protein